MNSLYSDLGNVAVSTVWISLTDGADGLKVQRALMSIKTIVCIVLKFP